MLVEWGLTPDYINSRFTEELLALMLRSRMRRIRRMQGKDIEPSKPKKIGSKEFFDRVSAVSQQYGGGIHVMKVPRKK
jgi:hypothetical protein